MEPRAYLGELAGRSQDAARSTARAAEAAAAAGYASVPRFYPINPLFLDLDSR